MKKLPNISLISLLYHEVTDDYSESGFQNKDNLPYIHTVKEFTENVNLVQKENSKVKLIQDINIQENESCVLFTFDDGGISAMRSSQILEQNGYRGHYFITTHYVDQHLFLSKTHILDLVKNNHCVGSHSHTHPMIFRSLSYKKMLEEWRISKEILEDIIGKEILCCSIPGGDVDAKTYDSAIEAGYRFIFNSEPDSSVYEKDNSYIIGRFSVKNSTSLETFRDILLYKNHHKLMRERKIKNTIKKLIFPIHSFIQNKKNIK